MAAANEKDNNKTELVRTIVERHLIPMERYIYGIADVEGVLDPQFSAFRSGISIGQRLDDGIVDDITSGPTLEYYELYKKTNQDLSILSNRIAQELNLNGVETACVEPSITTKSLDSDHSITLRTRLSHKMVATRAGMGWIGKTALLISKEFGPRFRLVTVLTDAKLHSNTHPINKSRCGKCNLCVEACPADAATGQLWDTSLDRDVFFNAQKCRDQCQEFGDRLLGGEGRICGICVSVCPIGINSRN